MRTSPQRQNARRDGDMNMEVETSTKTFAKRPKIKPGFYAAKLLAVKMKDKNGKFFEKPTKWGGVQNFAILDFQIFKKNEEDVVTGPATFVDGNNTSDVTLAQFVSWKFTNKGPDGETQTKSGFSPNSAATNTYRALGWGGPEEGKKLDLEEYVGKWAEVIVDDYKKVEDGKEVVFSVIKEVKPFAGKVPKELSGKQEEPSEPASPAQIDAYLAKVKQAEEQAANGFLTQRGFDALLASLKKEYGVE